MSEKNPATKCSLAASALIVACAKTGISGCYGGEEVTAIHNWYMFDLGIAVQTLCLKAHELGLGTVVVGLMDHEACKKILAVPEGRKVVAVIPIGRPATEPKEGPPRKSISEMVFLNNLDKRCFNETQAKRIWVDARNGMRPKFQKRNNLKVSDRKGQRNVVDYPGAGGGIRGYRAG